MDNYKYIKVKINDYGYEVYEVNGEKTRQFSPQEKIVIKEILRKFKYFNLGKNTLIFPNYDSIIQKFNQKKLITQHKKVNREKSKQIIAGVLIATSITGGIFAIDNITKGEQTSIWNANGEYYGEENINEFYYEFEKPKDKETLIKSQNYMELYRKYEKIYGVDANLLCAIGAQEGGGVHYETSINGYGTGIMGIEYIWEDAEIKVFNFEKNEYETIKVNYSKIGNLEYNIKIGAAIFQNYFYHTLKNPEAIEDTDYMAYTLQKYNMGPGNMRKVLGYGGNWRDNRDMINAGDKYYFEHVLSRLDNGTIIKLRLPDGSYYSTKLTNLSLEKHHSRN